MANCEKHDSHSVEQIEMINCLLPRIYVASPIEVYQHFDTIFGDIDDKTCTLHIRLHIIGIENMMSVYK